MFRSFMIHHKNIFKTEIPDAAIVNASKRQKERIHK